MLRRQPSSDAMSFLAGNSEMARRIREYDWASHPFGPAESWPQSLRSALGICLQSAFPTAIYWGSELRLLYNDAWAPIPGPRHPAALGAPAREVWSDIWHIIEPQFTHLISTGEGIFVEDQMLPMQRLGVVEETYWSYSFTPIRGEDGAIAGVFNSGSETTRNVLLQRQLRFLLDLAESFRISSDSPSARRIALEMLGRHLGVDRAGFRELLSGEADDLAVTEEWTAPGVPPVGRNVKLSDLGAWASTQIREGRVLRIDDPDSNPDTVEARKILQEMGVSAAVAVPWVDSGRVTAIMFLHSRAPRIWTDFDIATAQEVLERTLTWIEREKAAEREKIMTREIDHRARNILAVVQSVVRLTVASNVSDFRKKIEDRIAALARTHSLLSSERWEPIELELLLNQELSPYAERDSTAIRTGGPKVPLSSEQAQTMALLLHELTTNAAKYGALSWPEGKLDVTWSLDQSGALVINWLEGVPSTKRQAPRSKQRGFGMTMLNRVIEKQFGGSISRGFRSGWLHCVLTIPLGSTGTRQS